jgi:hypothetical protein
LQLKQRNGRFAVNFRLTLSSPSLVLERTILRDPQTGQVFMETIPRVF